MNVKKFQQSFSRTKKYFLTFKDIIEVDFQSYYKPSEKFRKVCSNFESLSRRADTLLSASLTSKIHKDLERELSEFKKDVYNGNLFEELKELIQSLEKIFRIYVCHDLESKLLTTPFIRAVQKLHNELEKFDDDDETSKMLDSLDFVLEEAEDLVGDTQTETAVKLTCGEAVDLSEVIYRIDFVEFFDKYFDMFVNRRLSGPDIEHGKYYTSEEEKRNYYIPYIIDEALSKGCPLEKFPKMLVEYIKSSFSLYSDRLRIFDAIVVFPEEYLDLDEEQQIEIKSLISKNSSARRNLSQIVENNLQNQYSFEKLKELITKDDEKKLKLNF